MVNSSLYRIIQSFFILFFIGTATANAVPTVEYSGERLTVRAKNESLTQVLEQVAQKANVVIFISKGFQPGKITVDLKQVPMEKALKKMLKELNFAAIYTKSGNRFKVSALKIYPKGESGDDGMEILMARPVLGKKDPLQEEGTTPVVPGLSLPGQYVAWAAQKHPSLVLPAQGFEQSEKTASQTIHEIQNLLGQMEEEAEKDRLTMALLRRLTQFEKMQKDHVNALESLYRAALFHQE